MKSLLSFGLTRIWAPLHARLIRAIAYGPWGPLHILFIKIFKSLYGIEYQSPLEFRTLGDFFLRPTEIHPANSPLVSPAESDLIDGPTKIDFHRPLSVKGLEYRWSDFKELEIQKFDSATYWNFYLAPSHYHWVHSPCEGVNLTAIRTSGLQYPVNALGRWLCPALYSINERLTFRFQSPEFGEVILFCVGAVGVSALHSDLGEVPYNRWVPLKRTVSKCEKLLAFKLGSTVLMLVERGPQNPRQPKTTLVGQELV